MAFIERFPLILSLFCSLLITMISMFQTISFQALCTRASITLIAFYVLGIIIRAVLQDAEKQVKQKLMEEKQKQIEEAKAAELAAKALRQIEIEEKKESKVESRLNQVDDEFQALKVKELMMQGEE